MSEISLYHTQTFDTHEMMIHTKNLEQQAIARKLQIAMLYLLAISSNFIMKPPTAVYLCYYPAPRC
jgi:hypothetical protein